MDLFNTSTALDVLIVGAGMAGMSAAHNLLLHQQQQQQQHHYYNLHVVEARETVGGRTTNLFQGDHAIELGGTWVSPNHTALLALCRDLDVEVFRASFQNTTTYCSAAEASMEQQQEEDYPWWYWGPEFSEEENLQCKGRTIFHSSREKFTFDSPQALLQNMDENVLKELEAANQMIQESAESLKDLFCWNASTPGPQWSDLDDLTTSAALFPLLKSEEARSILRSAIHTRNAQEPNQVGFLYNLLSFQGCNSDGPDSEFRIRGGSQAVPLAVAKRLGPHRLTLSDPVREVRVQQDDGPIRVTTRSGKVWQTNTLILTGPPPAILNIDIHDPPLAADDAQLLQHMPMGSSRKVMALYERGPWWRDYGLTGDILAAVLPPHLTVPDGHHQQPIFNQCFDTTPFSQAFGVITCFVEGRANAYFSTLNESQQRKHFVRFLYHTFADFLTNDTTTKKKIWRPDSIPMYNWADHPYARGAYTAYFGPGVLSVPESWRAYRTMEKLPNVFLAGSDYHVGYGNGYMEGAVRSGRRAAELVQKRLDSVLSTTASQTEK